MKLNSQSNPKTNPIKMDTTLIIYLIIIGILAGMLSGLIGIGGGLLMVPMLVMLGFSQHQAQGTSITVLLFPVMAFAVYNYYKAGYVDFKYALIIAIFFAVGSYFGSKLAINFDQKNLQKIFGFILIIIAGKMILGK